MADDAFSSEDFDYEATRLSDGSIMVRFDLGELQTMAGEQAAGGSTEGLSDEIKSNQGICQSDVR